VYEIGEFLLPSHDEQTVIREKNFMDPHFCDIWGKSFFHLQKIFIFGDDSRNLGKMRILSSRESKLK